MNKQQENPPNQDLNRIIHEPARLLIMAHLAAVREADFRYLLFKTKLSRGNLSVQLKNLEEAGYLEIEKQFVGRVPRTLVSLTDEGHKALKRYKNDLKSLLGL